MTQTRPAAPAVPVKTTRDVLLHAALLIEERGWCQGVYESADGRLCLLGAINVAANGTYFPDNRAMEACYLLPAHVGLGFNDAPGRTAAEVIAALRAAAASEKPDPILTYTDPAGGPDWEPREDER